MRIGYHLGYWSSEPPPGAAEAVLAAEDLGFDSVWTAEAYGSDCLTPLAWWGSRTTRLRLGTAIAQLSARTPTATAMAAMTLDHLSGGRFVLGLGASGPRVVEGWYGQPYARPLARTREYVDVVRQVLTREAPVTSGGDFFPLPLPAGTGPGGTAPRCSGPGGTGLGTALRSTVHPLRADLPIMLAAQGPRNIALAAEIADGWLPLFYAPRFDEQARELLADGFTRRSAVRSPARAFEVCATVPVVIDDDVERAADTVRPFLALYMGGMGAPWANFHAAALARLGYGAVCTEVQSLYAAGRRAQAAAAVPLEMVQDVALIGPSAAVRERFAAWQRTAVTSLLVQCDPRQLPAVAHALDVRRPDAEPVDVR